MPILTSDIPLSSFRLSVAVASTEWKVLNDFHLLNPSKIPIVKSNMVMTPFAFCYPPTEITRFIHASSCIIRLYSSPSLSFNLVMDFLQYSLLINGKVSVKLGFFNPITIDE